MTSSDWQFDLDLNLTKRRCRGPIDGQALPVDANGLFRTRSQFFYRLAGHEDGWELGHVGAVTGGIAVSRILRAAGARFDRYAAQPPLITGNAEGP